MTLASPSLALDARALAALDQVLAMAAAQRSAWLAALSTDDPALHGRLLHLLAHCSDTGAGATGALAASRALAAPVLAGLQQATSPALQAGQQLAGWRLLCELGRGGMSVVWLAERADGSVKRQVALKLPLAAHLSTVLAERFTRERDVLAQLVHPHIARLYDAGLADTGQPFLVLEHVSGLPITQFADERHLGLRQRLQLFTQVLAAVDHAHRHLVVHRDLKPANILVDDDGQVKLLDFGIAKLLDAPADAAQLTLEAGAVMTPRYAAPEQVAGQPISTATDVYAAGAVLYELLTGRPPHPGAPEDAAAPAAALARLAQAVLHETPPAPSQAALDQRLRRQLAGDIDTVVMTALHKAPGDRYPSAERFAEDLRRLLASEPVLARRVPLWHRLRLLLRRHRRASAAAGLAALLLLGVGIVALQQWQESNAQRSRGDAVRDFMFQMVSDAEVDETQAGGEVTGRQMVDAAVARAQREMADQPRLQGELLGELGRVYARLDASAASEKTLAQAVAVLSAHVPPDDPALNKARAHLAGQRLQSTPDEARALAESVLAACRQPGRDCAMARSYAHATLMVLWSDQGQDALALEQARLNLQAARLGFGMRSADTALALEWLAVVARNQGQFAAARQAIDEAVAMTQQVPLRASHRLGMRRTQAMLLLDLGQAAAARDALGSLVTQPQTDTELAVQWRLLASAHWALGAPAQALEAARRSSGLARAQDDTLGVLLADQVATRALSLLGRHAEARSEAARINRALTPDDGGPNQHADPLQRVRGLRLAAEVHLRAGDLAGAQDLLGGAHALRQSATGFPPIEAAEVLDLQGCLDRATARWEDAARAHRQARALWLATLPVTHPLVLRNAFYATLAASPPDAPAVAQAAQSFAAHLEAKSAWRESLSPWLAASPHRVAAPPSAGQGHPILHLVF